MYRAYLLPKKPYRDRFYNLGLVFHTPLNYDLGLFAEFITYAHSRRSIAELLTPLIWLRENEY
jgi:hypothetical protein